ncbi:peptidoglycan editing factor PgeF [Candidatus Pseudothioglobus sp. Uisw_086]|jgi:YfiH family protein|uniref:peptidoglycan editing factor PgeF n=1 Tax=Candidatus Pseudothioglobus sp. Uisw_086 TaxID=3230998 RepID=UPI003A8A8265
MNFFPNNVKLLSTPRILEGGSSEGSFNNFNLALHVNDKKSSVLANRDLLLRCYNLPSAPVWINQTHSNKSVDAASISSIVDADASYSKKLGTVCGVLTADCLPVFICNKEGTTVGIAHAGWRGLVDGIIESLIESFNCKGEDLMVHLGPAISQLSFEVGGEVKSQYLSKNKNFESCFIDLNNKYYLDLYEAARVVLKSFGVSSISGGDRCTYKESDQYFSYRRDGKCSGRMAHLIWMERL